MEGGGYPSAPISSTIALAGAGRAGLLRREQTGQQNSRASRGRAVGAG